MQFIKRVSIYLIFLLLFVSIYKDLFASSENYSSKVPEQLAFTEELTGIKTRVHAGDTVLSVVEELNKDNQILKTDITQMIADFKKLNPHIDPYNLQSNHFYYFPLYNST